MRKYLSTVSLLSVLGLSILSAPADAAGHGDHSSETERHWLEEALFEGDLDIEVRYRYQFLDVEGFNSNAHASTVRALVKYETKPVHGVSVLGEVRSVQRLGTGDLFNDTLNGNTGRPVIADPDAFEVDQALIKFQDILPDTTLTAGRRKIALNNQRFISTLPFRQNANSFDGVVLENTSLPNTYLHYSYAYNFNRAFTDDSLVGNFDDANFHLFHGEYDHADWLKLVGYGYILAIEEDSFPGSQTFATNTFGVNAKGWYPLADNWRLHYDAEYANQTDNNENTANFDLDYYRFVPGVSYKNWRLNAGIEVLEGDGNNSFSTPLALLHAFNGFADVFVNTPDDGLEDRFVNLTYHVKDSGVKIGNYDLLGNSSYHVSYHDFEADDSNADFGQELDVSIKKKLTKNITLVMEYAHYDSDFDGPVIGTTPAFNRDIDQFYTALVFKF